MTSAAKPLPKYPEEMILRLLLEWELQFDEQAIYQKTPDDIREFCNSMTSHIGKFQYQSCFFDNVLVRKTVFKLVLKLICDWSDVTNQYSPAYDVVHFFLKQALKLNGSFEILDCAPDTDFTIRTPINNLANVRSGSDLDTLYNFFKLVSTTEKGREQLIGNGFLHTVHKLETRYNSGEWKKKISIFNDLVVFLKQQKGYQESVMKCFEKSIVPRRFENQLKLSYHENCCYLNSSLELLMSLPEISDIICENSTTDPLCKIIAEVFILLGKNENSVFRTSVLLEFIMCESYNGLMIGSAFGGISLELTHHIINSYPQIVSYFLTEFDTVNNKPEDSIIPMDSTRIQITALKTDKDGYQISHKLIGSSKFMLISFCIPSVMFDYLLKCSKKTGGSVKYRLTAFNTTTEAENSKHSTIYLKKGNKWLKCSNGRSINEKFDKPIADVTWSLWTFCEEIKAKSQEANVKSEEGIATK